MFCLRPMLTGSFLWTREGRDHDRKSDAVRCLCGNDNCRDTEVAKRDG